MKSVVWSYKDKKPVFFLKDKFYIIKDRKDYEDLIDSLLDIDAVSTPVELESKSSKGQKYPYVLKLEEGFSPNLVMSSLSEYRQELEKEANELNKKLTKLNKIKF